MWKHVVFSTMTRIGQVGRLLYKYFTKFQHHYFSDPPVNIWAEATFPSILHLMFLLHCLYKIVITAWFWIVAVWMDVAGRHHHLHHLNVFTLDRNAIKTTRPPECKTFDDDTNTFLYHHLYNLLPRQGGLSMPHSPAPTVLAPPWPRAEQTSSSGFVCYFFFQRRASIFLPLSSFCCKIVLGRKMLKVAWCYMYSN